MNIKCDMCKVVPRDDAEYVIQWGPGQDQKVYACKSHLIYALDGISAMEFFIVKIKKVEDDGS